MFAWVDVAFWLPGGIALGVWQYQNIMKLILGGEGLAAKMKADAEAILAKIAAAKAAVTK
ncbi:hypothetical protein [Bradyrhizobium sp.]|uniref:hypothetical protein n=1 Tax=Bradyrhizobium sp. TaxID=376 RepID=UPI002D3E6432|nr:hypothetical protein [Bradyrhizobium sp.]HZR77347.1 hypothetical protein [Bradyrhizobium sp.]